MKTYRLDLQVGATAYVNANNEDEAKVLFDKLSNTTLIVDERPASDEHGPEITDLPYKMSPELSLSPAMTIHGRFPGATIEFVEER